MYLEAKRTGDMEGLPVWVLAHPGLREYMYADGEKVRGEAEAHNGFHGKTVVQTTSG